MGYEPFTGDMQSFANKIKSELLVWGHSLFCGEKTAQQRVGARERRSDEETRKETPPVIGLAIASPHEICVNVII